MSEFGGLREHEQAHHALTLLTEGSMDKRIIEAFSPAVCFELIWKVGDKYALQYSITLCLTMTGLSDILDGSRTVTDLLYAY